MQWKDVVTMAADVARNGFNVTHDLGKWSEGTVADDTLWLEHSAQPSVSTKQLLLSSPSPAEALGKIKDQNMSTSFRDLFLPNDQAPLFGLFTRRLDLAAILDAVAVKGISEFYSGNLSQEMAAAVSIRVFAPHFFQLCHELYSVCQSTFSHFQAKKGKYNAHIKNKTFLLGLLCTLVKKKINCHCCIYTHFAFSIGASTRRGAHRGGLCELQHSLTTTSRDHLSG